MCFPNFDAARTPYLMYDVYTNDSLHKVCFSTVILSHLKILVPTGLNIVSVIELGKRTAKLISITLFEKHYSMIRDYTL